MATRKTAARKRPAAKSSTRRRVPSELDDLTVPGNAEHQGAVTVTLDQASGIAAYRPDSWDRLDDHTRAALAQVMLLMGQRRQLAAEVETVVKHLRERHGVPWSAVAFATGMTAEGARRRWS